MINDMSDLNFTNHARLRCQQRGISVPVVEFVVEHGNAVRTHNDKKFYINKSMLNALKHKNNDFVKKNDKYILTTAVIVNGNNVITCMKKKSKKLKWN